MRKDVICATLGLIGSAIANFFGGWDSAMITLIIFMGIDYFSGFIVAAVFKNSSKTESGALESKAGWKGLCRKCMTLLFVLIGHRLDLVFGVDYVRNAVIIGFTANELISIMENADSMGIKLPPIVSNALDIVLKKKDVSEDVKD